MIRNNCLDSTSRTIESASDRIQAIKQKTIYKTLENNMINYNTPNPLKKNNVQYDNTFGFKLCDDDSGVITSSKSYESLLDITKGKYFTNPLLLGITPAVGSMWSGNLLVMDYAMNDIKYPIQTWLGRNGDDDGAITMDPSGTTIPTIGDVNGPGNEGPFDLSWNWVPGYTIDPSNQLFYHHCSALHNIPTWYTYLDLSFNNSHLFWNGVIKNPLQGMKYHSPIKLNNQTPVTTYYSPTIDATYSWCTNFPQKID